MVKQVGISHSWHDNKVAQSTRDETCESKYIISLVNKQLQFQDNTVYVYTKHFTVHKLDKTLSALLNTQLSLDIKLD